MRLSEILEESKQYLFPNGDQYFICDAVAQTIRHYVVDVDLYREIVRKIQDELGERSCLYHVYDPATDFALVEVVQLKSSEYILYRDNWLNQLIIKVRSQEI
jgi:hypothetical protein